MNYKEKQETIKKFKQLLLNPYSEGCIKISKGESRQHRQVKADVCGWLKENDWDIWTECNLKGFKGVLGRCDIFAIHNSGMAVICEIMASESEKQLSQKDYHIIDNLFFKSVKAKDFDYERFKL